MDVTQVFGKNVFSDSVMRKVLPNNVYKSLKETVEKGIELKADVADVVANAMKDWAIEKGATHYTHWFQPLTGSTAEKHDSFIEPSADGTVIMKFSGKQLIKGEPDASSFPSGGLRATFEARGYTAWDTTSPAFLKEDASGDVTLCIPTAFCSYTSEALDKKTPLLRSMEAVSKQALRILKAMGNTTAKRVTSTVGPEQEYFLVDKELFDQRLDFILAGRTLFGATPPKGQEMEDQYFGAIKDRVLDFMKDLNAELWKMGVSSKTQHNEVAPAQYEMAPVFATTNIGADHNQLVMETMKKVALRHGLVCLLHEKPYAGINGSGKHLNWSLATDDGTNLLEPGSTPHDNAQFLVFLSALIKAVDENADMLRRSAANAGNDHRLGANEAPPAIISIFLGDELTCIMQAIEKGEKASSKDSGFIKVGVDALPALPKDNTDRNRTSPFAFTGNKFEFRMVGSAASVSGPCVVLNTIAADAFDEIATRLEKAKDTNKEVTAIVQETMKKHGRIIFNGNNYSDEWVAEAEKRNLLNIKSTIDALQTLLSDKTIKMFKKHKILSKREIHARYDIYLDQYSKQINIEALTALDMVKSQYIPAVMAFVAELAGDISTLKAVSASTKVQVGLLKAASTLLESAQEKVFALEKALEKSQGISDVSRQAESYRDDVFTAMGCLREDIDALERITPRDLWPVPTYADLLFRL